MQLVWDEFLKIIREEAGNQVVETWFKAVRLDRWDKQSNTAILCMPNHFVSRWIKEHYTNLLKTHLGRLLHTTQINLSFEDRQSLSSDAISTPGIIVPAQSIKSPTHIRTHQIRPLQVSGHISGVPMETKLDEKYTFESFIVGPSNSLAHAAARAVARDPGNDYNPLFVYGGTGLGKTHLLHCIGNEVLKNDPTRRVRYETSDRFMGEFIAAIRFEKIHRFRQKYENLDLLLIDDVQFFSNKEQTQEIFFHIFNSLYEKHKQIVLSSDVPPKDIDGLQSRLKSRMDWGLTVDIQAPDLETKIAILSRKADLLNIDLPNDTANFIASRPTTNIRELEGLLTRISACARLSRQEITLDLARKSLKDEEEIRHDGILLRHVLRVVCEQYGISPTDIKSKRRSKDLAFVRQISFFLMKKLTPSPLQAIGEYVGNRNHSTVIHSVDRIEQLVKSDESLGQKIKSVENEILARYG